MSNIANAFKNGKAFIPFFTCGFPDMETSKAAIKAAVDNGADLIELGIPFSDPTAEGPVIQRSTLGASIPTRFSRWSRNCGRKSRFRWSL